MDSETIKIKEANKLFKQRFSDFMTSEGFKYRLKSAKNNVKIFYAG